MPDGGPGRSAGNVDAPVSDGRGTAGADGALDVASGVPAQPPPGAAGPHVLILSVDGLHDIDVERYVLARPDSTLARLDKSGVRYTSALAPFPSDSFPGELALHTGGTPRSTGVFYDLSYDRKLAAAPGCAKLGAVVDFSDAIDLDPNADDGGGGLDVARLPRDPARGCAPVRPHQYLRVNTTFEVVRAAGMRTAWTDKHLTYEILNGPSGKGVDDLWNPEIAAKNNKTLDGSLAYDERKVAAILAQISGRDHTGKTIVGVPALFGMNFQAVSVAQKTLGAAYLDAKATPSPQLMTALDRTDQAIGSIVTALQGGGMWETTTLVITSAHGQAPIDPNIRKTIRPSSIAAAIDEVKAGLLAHLTADDVALVWLTDSAMAGAVARMLTNRADDLGIEDVLSGDALTQRFGLPANDSRLPDLIARVKPGVLFADKDNKAAEHGGDGVDDRHVALLVAGGRIKPAVVADRVGTQQVAPTALEALGLDPGLLDAVRVEQTSALPGISRGN